MKTLFLLAFAVSISYGLLAQTFQRDTVLYLPDWQQTHSTWADWDHNGLPDLAVSGKLPNGTWQVQLAWQQRGGQWAKQEVNNLAMSDLRLFPAYFSTDTLPGLIMMGKTANGQPNVRFFRTLSPVVEMPQLAVVPLLGTLAVADFNRDGQADLVISGKDASGQSRTDLYWGSAIGLLAAQSWPGWEVEQFAVLDANRDGFPELAASGRDAQGDSATWVWANQAGKLGNAPIFQQAGSGGLTVGDLNHDGFPDLAVGGQTAISLLINELGNEFEATPLDYPQAQTLLAADFDKDGRCDLLASDGNATRLFLQQEDFVLQPDTLLPALPIGSWMDVDTDGDLDLTFLSATDTAKQGWYRNRYAPDNAIPTPPTNPYAISIFGRTMFSWSPAVDDHTPAAALTYDLQILLEGQTGAIANAYFEADSGVRALPVHGHVGHQAFYTLLRPLTGRIQWGVQAVDNSLAFRPCSCSGQSSGGRCSSNVLYDCLDIQQRDTVVCEGVMATFTAPRSVAWFSLSAGYLGEGASLEHVFTQADTLFYLVPGESDCAQSVAYSVQLSPRNETFSLGEDREVEKGNTIALNAGNTWQSVVWQSAKQGEIGRQPALQWLAEVTDTLMATVVSSGGCRYADTVVVRVKPPVFTVVFVPTLFTPNGDGTNETLQVFGAEDAQEVVFEVFDKQGNRVFRSEDALTLQTSGWDGTKDGSKLPTGMYFWSLRGRYPDGSPLLFQGRSTGYVQLLR